MALPETNPRYLNVFFPSRLGVVERVIFSLLLNVLILPSSEEIAKPFAESPVFVNAELPPHCRQEEHRLE